MKTVIFKIKEGKVDTWKQWCTDVNTIFRSEAIEAIKEEGIKYEAFSIVNIGTDFYTIGFGDDGTNIPNMEREINKKHKEMKKECLEFIDVVDTEYELIG